MKELFIVVERLYESEINSGIQAEYAAGFDVWLGDSVKGYHSVRNFSSDQLSAAANWLHTEACRIYPKSKYALSSNEL